MAIVAATARVSLVGHLGTSELFDTSFWVSGGVPISQALANQMAGEISTLMNTTLLGTNGVKTLLSNDCGYDTVKVYAYPEGGPKAQYVGEAAIASGAGTVASNILPLQCSLVTTLRTGQPGRSRRGRMYWPVTATDLDSGHQFTHGATFLTQVKAFFDGVNATVASSGVSVVVMSSTLGQTFVVNQVSCDKKLDIQRRRAVRQPGGTPSTVAIVA